VDWGKEENPPILELTNKKYLRQSPPKDHDRELEMGRDHNEWGKSISKGEPWSLKGGKTVN